MDRGRVCERERERERERVGGDRWVKEKARETEREWGIGE